MTLFERVRECVRVETREVLCDAFLMLLWASGSELRHCMKCRRSVLVELRPEEPARMVYCCDRPTYRAADFGRRTVIRRWLAGTGEP